MSNLLFRYDQEWTERVIADVIEAMEEIAVKDLGLDVFRNQITIVPDTGMMDAYANNGMPFYYPHWSFGKRWKEFEIQLKQGRLNLAYELVVPTDPCISWNMSSNGMATMALVIAHAAFGHNAVFKNNYLFRKWTHSSVLADQCKYARDLVLECENLYGVDEVESLLDAVHALLIPCGVFRHGEPPAYDLKREKERLAERMRALESGINLELVRTVPGLADKLGEIPALPKNEPHLPEENILFFIEKYAPGLPAWKREIIRIVRTIAQQTSFPMHQTKTVHEGAATFTHNYIMQKLYAQGRLDDGTMIELARMNSNVLYQQELRETHELSPEFNPYTLGFGISKEIVRISGMNDADKAFFNGWVDTNGPSEEDRQWFSFAGDGDWRACLRHAWYDYRDDSFIEQFLTPRLMRQWQMFGIVDDEDAYLVTDTVHERTTLKTGYESIRQKLAGAHSWDAKFPDLSVIGVDLLGDRKLKLSYRPRESMELMPDADDVLGHVEELWGYEVDLVTAG